MIKETASKVLAKLEQITNKKILVVGDLGVDEYVTGDVNRISPEAPVPVVEVTNQNSCLGLSGNVAQNISSLLSQPILLSVVGDDGAADHIGQLLAKEKVSADYLIRDSSRPTTRKLRVLAGPHHVVRVDYEQRRFLSPEIEKKVLDRAGEIMPKIDGVIIQDYAKGVISESVSQKIIQMAKKQNKKVLVDPHRNTPINYYRGADVIKPNFQEALILSNLSSDDLRENKNLLRDMLETLKKRADSQRIVITRGKQGITFIENNTVNEVPTFAKEVFDVTGAGDTVISALTLGWISGFSMFEACVLANAAAGVVVAQIGSVPCHFKEAQEALEKLKNFQE